MKNEIKKAIEDHIADGALVTDPDGLVRRIEAALGPIKTQSPKKEGVHFPMHYNGWRIEIRMGHEFGRRGAVANYRGYIATRLSDGKVHKLIPSSAGSASLKGVKAIIDIEEGA